MGKSHGGKENRIFIQELDQGNIGHKYSILNAHSVFYRTRFLCPTSNTKNNSQNFQKWYKTKPRKKMHEKRL